MTILAKAPNYSEAQETIILTAALDDKIFDHARAKEIAESMGKKASSIIAKLKRLENDPIVNPLGESWYTAKPAYVAKTGDAVEKKGDVVTSIEKLLSVESGHFKGLDKAPKGSLVKLRASIIKLDALIAEVIQSSQDAKLEG